MRVFLNELSLENAFGTSADLVDAILELVEARLRSPTLSRSLFCSRQLPETTAVSGETVRQTIARGKRDDRARIFEWIGRYGPFVEDNRSDNEDDLFWFETVDVTNFGFGEAARRILLKDDSATFSFARQGNATFAKTPILIIHGLLERPLANVDVLNVWSTDQLIALAESVPEISSWGHLIDFCNSRYTKLVIGPDTFSGVLRWPFSSSLSRSIINLLDSLHQIAIGLRNDGSLSKTSDDARKKFFIGHDPLFTDESDANKLDFKADMTFADPSGGDKKITCFWHGKINNPKFRIHFEWPPANPTKGIKIAYVGPKISKR